MMLPTASPRRTPYQRLAELAIERSGLLGLLERMGTPSAAGLLPILLLHRIEEPAACGYVRSPDLISATPAVFATQMEFLARKFNPIRVADLLAALDGAPLPRRAVLLTFDDGTSDFMEHVWPTLKRVGVPAALCVPTQVIGQPGAIFWEDRLHQVIARTKATHAVVQGFGAIELDSPAARLSAAAELRIWLHGFPGAVPDAIVDHMEVQLDVKAEPFGGVLSWDSVREVSDGVDILPHGRRHVRLEGMGEPELDAEVAGALADIREQLGSCLPVFSYPYGRFDARVLETAQRAGYRAAFSTRAGFAKLRPSEHLRLRRVHIYHGTLAHFRLDLTPAFAWYTARREDLSAARQRRRA
jgi:peptidoglycan/xylan/chitin deacetylase (PgdA/CDA1 family)